MKTRASAASAPFDYVAVSLLASVGATLANVRRPLAGANWCEPPHLWMALVGPPSSGKSPALSTVRPLLESVERQRGMTFEEEQRLYDKARTIADLKKANWETELKAAIRDKAVHPPKPLDTLGPPPSLPRLQSGIRQPRHW